MKPIQLIEYVHNLSEANYLQVAIVSDNLTSMCQLTWALLNVIDEITEDMTTPVQTLIYSGNATISGTDYTSWNGNNDYPFTYVANQIGVTLV